MFAGESVMRRLDRLAQAVGLERGDRGGTGAGGMIRLAARPTRGAMPSGRRGCGLTPLLHRADRQAAGSDAGRLRAAHRRRAGVGDGGRRPIAGILVLEETPEGFLLDNIAVLPECQGSGYGRG